MSSGGDNILKRVEVPELDALLGVAIHVLDDGFVRVVDYMGSDESIVQAARVSYGVGTKRIREDRGLVRYLLGHRHTTPFEMCEIKLHVRAPMDCWRQWIRHRTANVNEYSTRYSVAIDAAQTTNPNEWRKQDVGNRQGSSGSLPPELGRELSERERQLQSAARHEYEHRLNQGVAREQARKDLPLSTYTEAYWKTDLHNLLHFLELRMASNAQLEIRDYARAIGEKIVSKWCPITWEAFLEYNVDSVHLAAFEADIVKRLSEGDSETVLSIANQLGWITDDGKAKKSRERIEAEKKLKRLGLAVPWKS